MNQQIESDRLNRFVCIYCGLEKSLDTFSLEHIFPERLGGALCSAFFRTDNVCERCNNLCGLFVDGAFIKSLFQTNAEASAARTYIDPRTADSVSPLSYLGRSAELTIPEDQTCEVWLGPCGEQLYHVHLRDELRWDSITGGDPIARKRDPGRLFIVFTTIQKDWLNLALRSAKYYFPKAFRYGVGVTLVGDPKDQQFLDVMDQESEQLAEAIWNLPKEKSLGVLIDSAFDDRFMFKIALGLGFNMFGEAFLAADYTRKLREALWQSDLQKRRLVGLYGSPFLSVKTDPTAEMIGWKGAYTVRLQGVKDKFALSLYLQDCSVIHTVIATDPSLWRRIALSAYSTGVVFLIVPQVNKFLGPIPLGSYLLHKLGGAQLAELNCLEAMRVDASTLPIP